MTQTQTINAKDLFRRAYENRYTWDENFPGYTADIFMKKGDLIATGKIKISSDLQYEITGVEDKQCLQAIKNQLWEIAIHRVNHGFEKTHGENTFSFGESEDSDSATIFVGGKGEGNMYKVSNNVVKLVHRRIGDKIVTINTTKIQDTAQGYLALEYNSTYVDAETGASIGGANFTKDDFIQVRDYYILSSRIMESHQEDKIDSVEFHFSNIFLT